MILKYPHCWFFVGLIAAGGVVLLCCAPIAISGAPIALVIKAGAIKVAGGACLSGGIAGIYV